MKGPNAEDASKPATGVVTTAPTVIHNKGAPQITSNTLFDKDNVGKDASGTKLIPNSRTALI